MFLVCCLVASDTGWYAASRYDVRTAVTFVVRTGMMLACALFRTYLLLSHRGAFLFTACFVTTYDRQDFREVRAHARTSSSVPCLVRTCPAGTGTWYHFFCRVFVCTLRACRACVLHGDGSNHQINKVHKPSTLAPDTHYLCTAAPTAVPPTACAWLLGSTLRIRPPSPQPKGQRGALETLS